MYRKIFCILLCIGLILSSCNNYEKNEEKEISNYYEDELNIMHIEADNPDFKNYINDVSRKLNMKINIIPCPAMQIIDRRKFQHYFYQEIQILI